LWEDFEREWNVVPEEIKTLRFAFEVRIDDKPVGKRALANVRFDDLETSG
jgi:hypothetical protein